MQKSKKIIKYFKVNDKGTTVRIKQPNVNELTSLYYILLKNLDKIEKKTTQTIRS